MENTQKTSSPIGAIAMAISIMVVAGLAFIKTGEFVSLEKAKVQSAAVDNCFKSAQVETNRQVEEEKKVLKITEPVRDIYNYCLRDKGFEPTK